MGDRLVKAHRMKMALLLVWNQALHIFQGAGQFRLAMAFQHRHINEKIKARRPVAEVQFQPFTVAYMKRVLLCIHKRNSILPAKVQISTYFGRFRSFIPNPGAFQHKKLCKTSLLKVFDDTGHDLRVGRRSPGSLRGSHQVRLDANPGIFCRDPALKLRFRKQKLCHLFIIGPVNFQDLIFFHRSVLSQKQVESLQIQL